MSEDPKQPESDKPAEKDGIVRIQVGAKTISSAQVRPRLISCETIKHAKERVLQNLSGSGAASFSEIVTDTTLPVELASVVIGELETEGKVIVGIAEGLKWVQLKK